jgi:dipeptide transport system permease protein
MVRFFLHKVFLLLITLWGASLIAFTLIRLVPGDPVLNLLGERGGTEEQIAEMKQKLGFDKSLPEQYLLFVGHALQGDLGTSVISQRPVSEEFWTRFPATLELGLFSMSIAFLIGLPLGILAAVRRNTVFDYGVMGFSTVGYSMPIFWWGLLLILLFSVNLGWLPVSGRIDVIYDFPTKTGFLLLDSWLSNADPSEKWSAFKSALSHLILPAIVLGTIPLAILARMTRSSLIEVLGEDFIRAAAAKGVSRRRLIWVHALRNALIPVVTVMGLLLGSIMTGAVLTETMFSWPGVGRWLIKSIEARDYPVIQGGILYTSFGVVIINLAVDLIYVWAQPRLRRRPT